MPIFVHNLSLVPGQPEEAACAAALRRLGVSAGQVQSAAVRRLSVDARHKNSIRLVCSAEVCLKDPAAEAPLVRRLGAADIVLSQEAALEVVRGTRPLKNRPVVVGFGPAGMFAALLLAREGYCPVVLERGGSIEQRAAAVQSFWDGGPFLPECNVQFGEGGAGTFSDGKLTTRINDPLCGFVLREMVRFGAPESILKQAKPHIGTDRLRQVVAAVRREVCRLGGEVRFNTRLTGLEEKDGALCGFSTGDGRQEAAQALVLAPGHSARDVFELLGRSGAQLAAKPFSVGVRIEHLQASVDTALYGSSAGLPGLPAGEYQLSLRQGDRAVYTFCMCPGGVVVPAASEEGGVVVNGMSCYARDGANANSALVVSVDGRDFGPGVLDGVAFQRRLEQAAYAAGGGGFRAPAQDVGSFLQRRAGLRLGHVQPSYARGVAPADFHALFPAAVSQMLETGLRAFDRRQAGFGAAEAVLTGVETRTSSPVRVVRGDDRQSAALRGLYPCGEGAGYAGGIMSAAVDGLRCALALMAANAPAPSDS